MKTCLPPAEALAWAQLVRAAEGPVIKPSQYGHASMQRVTRDGVQLFTLTREGALTFVFNVDPDNLKPAAACSVCAPLNGDHVHGGVALMLDKMWGHMVSIMKQHPEHKYSFTGHGFAGAIAIEAARRTVRSIRATGYQVNAFGPIKSYGPKAKFPRADFFNFVAIYLGHLDPVPRMLPGTLDRLAVLLSPGSWGKYTMPKREVRRGYRHGGAVFYHDSPRWVANPGRWYMARRWAETLRDGNMGEHDIDHYVLALGGNRRERKP